MTLLIHVSFGDTDVHKTGTGQYSKYFISAEQDVELWLMIFPNDLFI